ncbi:MAG: hypothetical protein ACOX4U_02765 [Anaerovoracaceae bacterium]|jgi:hypothetical protein
MRFSIFVFTLLLLFAITSPITPVHGATEGTLIAADAEEYTLIFSGVSNAITLKDTTEKGSDNPLGFVYTLVPDSYISLTSKTDGIHQSISFYDNEDSRIRSCSMEGCIPEEPGEGFLIAKSDTLTYRIPQPDPDISYMSVDIRNREKTIYVYFLIDSDVNPDKPVEISKRIINATPTSSIIKVNGKVQGFKSFYVDGHNYFKLRDLAAALGSSEVSFEIDYDAKTGNINIYTKMPYTPVGGELGNVSDSSSKTGIATPSTLFLDGKQLNLISYLIDGNNYYKLRDMGRALDFGVEWIAKSNTILIDTSKSYTK